MVAEIIYPQFFFLPFKGRICVDWGNIEFCVVN